MTIVSKPQSQGYRAQNVLPDQTSAEALAEGDVVQLKPGTGKWEKGKAGTATPKRGIVLNGGATGPDESIDVQVLDVVGDYPASTFTQGAIQYLSHSVDGGMTETRPPITDGKSIFVVGQALNDTDIRLILETLQDGETPGIKVEDDDVQVVPRAFIVNFGNDLFVTDDGNGKVTVDSGGDPGGSLGDARFVWTYADTGKTKNKFTFAAGKSSPSHEATYIASNSGSIRAVTISTRLDPDDDIRIQIIKNATKGGTGVYKGGTQIGTDLVTNTVDLDQEFGNLSGYNFCKNDRISVYLKKGPTGQGTANDPLICLYVRFDAVNTCTGGVGGGP